MGKYIGPKVKIVRRLGVLPGLTQKIIKNKKKTPGEHGKPIYIKQKRISLSDEYKLKLIEKQKLRFNYGLSEAQLYSYYKQAKKSFKSTGLALLELLESRLDCIIYRSGFAPTIPAARQLINHNHFCVNNKKVNIASFLCKPGDLISTKNTVRTKALITNNLKDSISNRRFLFNKFKNTNIMWKFESLLFPKHLSVENSVLSSKVLTTVKRNNLLLAINELKVVEFYSK